LKKRSKKLLLLWPSVVSRARAKLTRFFLLLFFSKKRSSCLLLLCLPYANVDAPKGGTFTYGEVGDFNNLNPFILRGTAPDAVYHVWQTLFKGSDTDSVEVYPDLALSMDVFPGRVVFHLDPAARFSDGVPVTAADVVWSFDTLTSKGEPFYAGYYKGVARVVALDAHTVAFDERPGAGAGLPVDLAGLYVLPEHFWKGRDFSAPLRDSPVGSGAYKISAVTFGESVTLTHVKDWWAAQKPANLGFDNFESVTEEFFHDPVLLRQAFKAGQLDVLVEQSPQAWASQNYGSGVARALVPETLPAGISGLAFNTRRAVFADVRVRQALSLAFDFEWANRVLFYGAYTRENSYFSNSPMASSGLPDAAELALMAPWRDKIPAAVFDRVFHLPVTDGSGYNLPQLRQAMALLNAAGWHVRDSVLVNADGLPMRFEIVLDDAADARLVFPYVHDLKLLGIMADIRVLDAASYQRRVQNFDYDMMKISIPATDAPGVEEAGYWGCGSASVPGDENYAGVCSPAVDAMIAAEIEAPDAEQKRAAIHALDRLLLNGYYVLPWYYQGSDRLAWWRDRVAKPDFPLQIGYDFDLWWHK
jgi:microcin C transport system substrate-binding protein